MQGNNIMSSISIIVPVYNTEKYLDRCISSIIRQTFRDIEILLINDGSNDNSLEILQRYSNADDRIAIVNQVNKGLSSARNTGIKVSKGTYIMHVDSDDWIEPDMCEILYKEAKIFSADIVTSNVYFDYFNKTIIKKEPYKKINNFREYLLAFTIKRGLNSIWNKLIKRDLYTLNNIEHYEDISLGEDSSTLLRLIPFANIIISVDKAFYHYDIKSSSMTGNKEKKIMEYIQALSKVENFYKKHNISTDLFTLLRLKIAYINLYGNIHSNLNEYKQMKKYFFADIKSIISNKHFNKLCIKYKCFVIMCLIIKKFTSYRAVHLNLH